MAKAAKGTPANVVAFTPPATPATDTATTAAKPATSRRRKQPVAHTSHDAQAAQQRAQAALAEIASMGATPDLALMTRLAEAYATSRMLVRKGVCTNDELCTEVYQAMADMLANVKADVLRQLEAQRKAQEEQGLGARLAVAKQPLMVARR
jgi:hypothetical protein